jgi:hypothetical protein
MIGNEEKHFQYLFEKSNKLATQAKYGQLSRKQAKTAYYSTYVPGMMYSLPATCLDEKQINKIQQSATKVFLRIQGYDMHFPRAVVYGPQIFGGLGFQVLYVETSCRRIEMLICEWNSETKLGKSMKLNINWVQLHCGIGVPIFESKDDLSYIMKNWFTVIQDFLLQINAELNIQGVWVPKKIRHNDRILMDEISRLEVTPQRKEIINNWRLYFGVNSLSQITNYKGDKLLDRYIQKCTVAKQETVKVTPIKWPIQQMPCIKTLPIWRKAIESITGCDKDGNLIRGKLGNWAPNYHNEITIYHFIHYTRRHMVIKHNDKWKLHRYMSNVYTIYYFEKEGSVIDNFCVEIYYPIDVEVQELHIMCHTKNYRTLDIEHLNNAKQLMSPEIRRLDKAMRLTAIVNNVIISEEWKELLKNDVADIIFCSDGGAKDNNGTFGLVASVRGKHILRNKNRIPKVHCDANSYRSEAFGMLGALCTYYVTKIYAENQRMEIPTQIKIVCDNAALVRTVKKYRTMSRPTKYYYSPDNDVITEILNYLQILTKENCKIGIQHVKGHQDKAQGTCTEEELLNIQADILATEARKMKNINDFNLPGTGITIKLNGLKIVSKHTQTLRRAYTSMNLRAYMKDNNGWNESTTENIWWTPLSKAIANFKEGNIMVIQKYIHQRWSCNERDNKFYTYRSNKCKLCSKQCDDKNLGRH